MAIAVQWQTVVTYSSSSTVQYTVPSSGNFGTYARDLVINNGGTANCFYSLGSGSTAATTAMSFVVPAGGSVILTQCQVPASSIIYAIGVGSGSTYIGFATNVAFV